MMPAIQAHLAPVKNPAPRARPRIPNTMTMYASATGPVPIPARREAAPKRERKPPAVATVAIIVTPTGLLGFGAEDCIISQFHVYMISLLDIPMVKAMSRLRDLRRLPSSNGELSAPYTCQRVLGSCGVRLPGLGVVLTAATG